MQGGWWRSYRLLAVASLRSRMAYRTDFILSTVTSALATLVDLVGTVFVILRVHTINGWGLWSVAYLFGVTSVGGGLFRMMASELYDFDKYLVQGELDSLLIRPTPVLTALLARGVNFSRLGLPLQGLAVTALALWQLWLPAHLGLLALVETLGIVVLGTIIWFAVGLAVAGVGFYTTRIDELQVTAIYGPTLAANYPQTIYPAWLRSLFMYVIPIAFASYFPAQYTLRLGGSALTFLYSTVAACCALAVALVIWNTGLRHYRSTGT